jgi:hypothetical protein
MYKRFCPYCGQILPAGNYRRRPNLDNPVEYLAPPTTAIGGVIPNPPEEVPRTPVAKSKLRLPFLKEDDDD